MYKSSEIESRLCVTIAERSLTQCLKIAEKHPFTELRGDLCNLTIRQVESFISLHPNTIFTYHITTCGNSRKEESLLKRAKNQSITAIRAGAAFVDINIEWAATAKQKELLMQYIATIKEMIARHKSPTELILSYHNFTTTPPLDSIKKIIKECVACGADYVKIATTANSIYQADIVRQLYYQSRKSIALDKENLIAFAMGEAGRYTRVASLFLGAPFTYCCAVAKKAAAKGQQSFRQMRSLLYNRSDKSINLSTVTINKLLDAKLPASKSIAQRAIIAAGLANGESRLKNITLCNDTSAAIELIKECGVKVVFEKGGAEKGGAEKGGAEKGGAEKGGAEKSGAEKSGAEKISSEKSCSLIIKSRGIESWNVPAKVSAGESALLKRVMLPLLTFYSTSQGKQQGSRAKQQNQIAIHCAGSLAGRDFSAEEKFIKENWQIFTPKEDGREIVISGIESSQFISGLLFTLPLINGDSLLVVENPKSTPYIELTLHLLRQFGIEIATKRTTNAIKFFIKGGSSYKSAEIDIEADWSSAANLLVAQAIDATLKNKEFNISKLLHTKQLYSRLRRESKQADRVIAEVLEGAVANKNGNAAARKSKQLAPFEFDCANSPDLAPILSTLALFCKGKSIIYSAERLFNKESNRAEAILLEFSKLGCHIALEQSGAEGGRFVLYGQKRSQKMGGKTTLLNEIYLNSHNDHRIAMALIIYSLFYLRTHSQSTIYINSTECINKSFPQFYEQLR